ncbi:substrate-binding domain-containing protein [Hydrogenophaga sp. 5NK40-0174]|uniref:substrate-binding domain-containing protein n=1 Tax=Hydrogenophaga sp. 5NK40-0174 TaxID=3127649 RepID=UPI0031067A7E
MTTTVTVISSMATKALLNELANAFESANPGILIDVESVGGIDAAKRVAAGEPYDVVMLASGALKKLANNNQVVASSVVPMVRSGVAVAVRSGEPHPSIADEEALKQAVLAAKTIGYSTGPSGTALAELFERWEIADQVNAKLVTPPPGIAVGSLVAEGKVALGFQQYSELKNVEGIDVLGPLPPRAQITTIFSAARGAKCRNGDAARLWLAYVTSPETADIKRNHGMEPA